MTKINERDIKVGDTYGRLKVIEETMVMSGRRFYFICICSCGKYKCTRSDGLIKYKNPSCGCWNKEVRRKDFTGKQFGRLTVLDATDRHYHSNTIWRCICTCGKIKEVNGSHLTSGQTKSCGCWHIERSRAQRGIRNSQYIDGRSSENDLIRHSAGMKHWKKQVFERDNYTCKKCNQKGIRLQAHHIYNFAEYIDQRLNIENGITMCKQCHINFHHIYGVRNNNQKQLTEFLST